MNAANSMQDARETLNRGPLGLCPRGTSPHARPRRGRRRIVIADAQPIMLAGLRVLLSERYEIVDCATHGDALVDAVRRHEPDAVICDIAMSGDGFDAARRIREIAPDTAIVLLTMTDSPVLAAGALRLGIRGYVLKTEALEQLVAAIESALVGRTHLSPALVNDTLSQLSASSRASGGNVVAALTERQIEVLRLIGQGHTMKVVAQKLHISPRTVAFHKYRIMDALGVKGNSQLIRKAVDCGLVAA